MSTNDEPQTIPDDVAVESSDMQTSNSKLAIELKDNLSQSTGVTSNVSSPKSAVTKLNSELGEVTTSEKHTFQDSEAKFEEEKVLPKNEIAVAQIEKSKKNEKKFFNKLLSIDKDAFGSIDGQNFILKQFWKSRENKIIVAQKNLKTFCGYACYIPQKDGSCYLMRIAVRNSHQRKGIGRLLMNQLMDEFHGKVELEVSADNTKAVNFYKKTGLILKNEFDTQEGVKFYKFSSKEE